MEREIARLQQEVDSAKAALEEANQSKKEEAEDDTGKTDVLIEQNFQLQSENDNLKALVAELKSGAGKGGKNGRSGERSEAN